MWSCRVAASSLEADSIVIAGIVLRKATQKGESV